ncbi:MAG: MFS transporter, partial [Polyangiaceae bacterium]
MSPNASPSRGPFPGYLVALVSTVAIILTAPGQTMLVSLLNVPLREAFDLQPLWLNTAYTVATITASLPLVWMGDRIDRHGPRRMLVVIAVAFGLACLFMASVAHVAMVVVGFFLLRFFGQGSLALASSHALAMWFHRRLGSISGVRMVALFAAWAPLPGLTLFLFQRIGWRATWALYGVVVAVVVGGLSAWLVRDRPEDLGLTLDGDEEPETDATGGGSDEEPGFSLHEALRTRAYWLLVAGAMMPPMIGTAMLFDIQPMLGARGIPAEDAATAVSAWSLTMAALAIPAGRLVDRRAPGPIIASGLAAVTVSCALLHQAATSAMAIAAMATYALGQSLIASAVGTSTARYFGRRHHGAIRSSLSRLGVIATGLGPLVMGASVTATGSYRAALVGFGVICLPAGVASLFLKPPASPDASPRASEA